MAGDGTGQHVLLDPVFQQRCEQGLQLAAIAAMCLRVCVSVRLPCRGMHSVSRSSLRSSLVPFVFPVLEDRLF